MHELETARFYSNVLYRVLRILAKSNSIAEMWVRILMGVRTHKGVSPKRNNFYAKSRRSLSNGGGETRERA